jgi:hypothetical protein
MTRLFFFMAIAFTFTACSTNSSSEATHSDIATAAVTIQKRSDTTNELLADTATVKTWLIGVIEDYTNNQNSNLAYANLQKSLTSNYYHYKQDAINLEYDDSEEALSEEDFKKKWQGKYNPKYVGYGGFIISAQDNGKIKVTKCVLLKNPGPNTSLYKVKIKDLDYKAEFNRDIKVVTEANRLFIDDVIEYD